MADLWPDHGDAKAKPPDWWWPVISDHIDDNGGGVRPLVRW